MDSSAHPWSVCLCLLLLVVVDPSVHTSVCLCNPPCCYGSVCPPHDLFVCVYCSLLLWIRLSTRLFVCVKLLVVVEPSAHPTACLCNAPCCYGFVCQLMVCLSVFNAPCCSWIRLSTHLFVCVMLLVVGDPSVHPRSVCLCLMLLVVVDPSVHP